MSSWWSCIECGISGSLTQPHPKVCSRRGLAIVKGRSRCCVCAKAAGWKGFDDCGCETCFTRIGQTFPDKRTTRENAVLSVDPPLAIPESAPWRLTPQPWRSTVASSVCWGTPSGLRSRSTVTSSLPDDVVIGMSPTATRIELFMFDGCLFRTPQRPARWPFACYHDMPQSLLPPVVPSNITGDWYHADAIAAACSAAADPTCATAVISTRRSYFRERVTAILENAIPPMDECFVMSASSVWSAFPGPKGAEETIREAGLNTCDLSMRCLPADIQQASFALYCLCAAVERVPSAKAVTVWVNRSSMADFLQSAVRHMRRDDLQLTVRVGGSGGPHEAMDPQAFARMMGEEAAVKGSSCGRRAPSLHAPRHSAVKGKAATKLTKHHDPFPADALPRFSRCDWRDKPGQPLIRTSHFSISRVHRSTSNSGVAAALEALDAPQKERVGARRLTTSVTPAALRDMGFTVGAQILHEVAASARSTDEAVSFLLAMQGKDQQRCEQQAFDAAGEDWPGLGAQCEAASDLGQEEDEEGESLGDYIVVVGEDDEWEHVEDDEVVSVASGLSRGGSWDEGGSTAATSEEAFGAGDAPAAKSYLAAACTPAGKRRATHQKGRVAAPARGGARCEEVTEGDESWASDVSDDGEFEEGEYGGGTGKLTRANQRAVQRWHRSLIAHKREESKTRFSRNDVVCAPQPIMPTVRVSVSQRKMPRRGQNEFFVQAVGREFAQGQSACDAFCSGCGGEE